MDFRMIIEGVQVHFLIGSEKINLTCESKTNAAIQVEAEDCKYTLERTLEIKLKAKGRLS